MDEISNDSTVRYCVKSKSTSFFSVLSKVFGKFCMELYPFQFLKQNEFEERFVRKFDSAIIVFFECGDVKFLEEINYPYMPLYFEILEGFINLQLYGFSGDLSFA